MKKRQLKKKLLKHHLANESGEAQQQLKVFIKIGGFEALHRFRVAAKKIRAFITLALEASVAKGMKKEFKPVRVIFRKAGYIRDAQLRITLGKAQKASRDFIAKQHRQLYESTRHFRLKGKAYLKKASKSHSKLLQLVKSQAVKKIRTYYTDQLRWIAENIDGSTALLHPCRKKLKILIYNYKFAHHALKQKLDKDYLKALEKVIGDWHDNYLNCRLFPPLQHKEKDLLEQVRILSGDFYAKATGKNQCIPF